MTQQSHFWVCIQNYWKHGLKEVFTHTHTHIHSIITHNSQETEATQVSTDGWTDKENVVYTHNGILFSL